MISSFITKQVLLVIDEFHMYKKDHVSPYHYGIVLNTKAPTKNQRHPEARAIMYVPCPRI